MTGAQQGQEDRSHGVALALDSRGMLPLGRHRAGARDVHDLFVVGAPFPAERARLWEALNAWVALARPLLPTARLWVDGGFVTHKTWAAPKDVDVSLIASPAEYAACDPRALEPLLTSNPPGGPRVQPMRGLVDAFVGVQGVDALVWADTWTRVTNEEHLIVDSERKGFVEVIDL